MDTAAADERVATAGARLDLALVATNLIESRAKAQEAIEAGLVTVDGRVARKPSVQVRPGARLAAAAPYPWVSRGGVKLAAALDHFGLDPRGRVCLDVGASTGGFTDVLLSRGALHVDAVDVGRGQLHPRIAQDERVADLSETDIRSLAAERLLAPPSLIVCDASFISLRLVLPPALALAAPACELVALVKPQFEVGPKHVVKGIVRDEGLRRTCCDQAAGLIAELGWTILGLMVSPIAGGEGNIEFLIGARRP